MKISIITVCLNSAKTIASAIDSVCTQEGVELEYIIVDGLSIDGTVDIINDYIKKYPGVIKYISGKDKGIYDAMNKGIQMADGDIIGLLNSDDYYFSKDVLSSVVKTISETNADSCYGNLLYVKNNRPYRYWKSGRQKSFKLGWMPPHPAFFVKKDVYMRYGKFRLDCGVNADYELMLRLFDLYNISAVWINKIFVCMAAGGRSNNGLKSRMNAIIDNRIAWKVNNLRPLFFTLSFKRLRKLYQFFSAKFFCPKSIQEKIL